MSLVKLFLQPPPNVDFVHGYPGIPPGADRPQAAVKGAVEVRPGPQGVKAKWLRIELRKVETLPGGGTGNTFYDFVGPSPVNLWTATASDEYALLRTQDFPFSIRIPESIPPTLTLDNRAGVRYELVASVCTMGKRGFFRKRKSVVVSAMEPVTIDKHELHSTWPVYCQPEIRHLSQDGVNLIVDRNHTCYGPGDRISLTATLKSDSLHTVILRGFEISLKESTIFRAGAFTTGKKASPQVRVVIVAENKFAVNATLYGGMQHKAELFCNLSPNHTTTTLNAARHIDITYTLIVRALLGTGAHIVMELPVVISNWQSTVSYEAIRRIGPAPSLSLIPPNAAQQSSNPVPNPTLATPIRQPVTTEPSTVNHQPAPTSALPQSSVVRPTQIQNTDASPGRVTSGPILHAYNTMPTSQSPATNASSAPNVNARPTIDEFGWTNQSGHMTSYDSAPVGRPGQLNQRGQAVRSSTYQADEFVRTNPTTTPIPNAGTAPYNPASSASPGTGRRPVSNRAGSGNTNRFTITNALPSELSEDNETPSQHQNSSTDNGPVAHAKAWPTAEEEKQMLYERAKAQAEKVQGGMGRVVTPPPRNISPPQAMVDAGPVLQTRQPARTMARSTPWPTAEEEKLRLFSEAQAAAQRTQHGVTTGTQQSASSHARQNSVNESGAFSQPQQPYIPSPGRTMSPAAAMYSQAMSSRNRSNSGNKSVTTPSKPGIVPQYPTAEQEKAALRRYQEAKEAVERTQKGHVSSPSSESNMSVSSKPVAYESLYPSSGPSKPPGNDLPPPFEASSSVSTHLSEKERLKRNYEMQDAATLAQQNGIVNAYDSPPPNPYGSSPPPPFPAGSSPHSIAQAISEKEQLRRKFEQQDAEALAAANNANPRVDASPPSPAVPPYTPRNSPSPSTLTRAHGSLSAGTRSRPPPVPPGASTGTSRVLTAAEEKARLRAMYDAEDATATSRRTPPVSGPAPSYSPTPSPPLPASTVPGAAKPAPPPLMPRPPVEYIQETQEEDARVSKIAVNGGFLPPLDEEYDVDHGLHRAKTVPSRITYGSGSGLALGQGKAGADPRQFTPLAATMEGASGNAAPSIPGPPPPLPPKPVGE